jgi:chromosome segregation ATPase
VRNSSSGEGGSEVSSNDAQLSALRSRIEAGRTRITALETQLQPAIDELDEVGWPHETVAAEIKSLDQQHAEGVAIDIDDRNSKVDEYDRLLQEKRALISANKSDIRPMDDLENQDASLDGTVESTGRQGSIDFPKRTYGTTDTHYWDLFSVVWSAGD